MTQGPDKREAKPFEPPPWEKEAFERLARERQEEERHEADVPVEPAAVAGEASQAAEQGPASEPESVAAGVGEEEQGEVKRPDDPAIAAMMIALKAEEPDAMKGAWKVSLAVGAVLVTMGLILIVWAAVGLARTLEAGPTGWFGAGIMGVMGAGFVAVGLWLGARSLRKQGVL